MTRNVTVTLYEVDELNQATRRTALENHRYAAVSEAYWHENLTRVVKRADGSGPEKESGAFQQQAHSRGFDLRAVRFNGFYSQGDGASFEARVDYADYILNNRLASQYRVLLDHLRGAQTEVEIITSGRSHSNTMDLADTTIGFEPLENSVWARRAAATAESQAARLRPRILATAKTLAESLYRQLEREFEYHTSDERLLETLRDKRYEFLSDGTSYPAADEAA